jgi:type IV secretory pathway protease TraF
MEPALRPGDFLVARSRGKVHRDALVVVQHPERRAFEMVKRVSAVPGDEIDGRRLGPRQYWLMGDNPQRSTDSRTLGPITSDDVKGVVLFRYWPPARIAWLR